jgi:putative CocE/NonD family hydrolase
MARVSMVVDRDVEARMRDGTVLRADVYRPAEGGPFPVLLMRTPYDRSQPLAVGAIPDPLTATARGYAVVLQDTRGRFGSEGAFVPFVHEAHDGYDTVEWVASESWCDGNVGMIGPSYVGYTQWMAASQQPPHLRAISPMVATSDLHDFWVYEGGAQSLWFGVSWLMASLGQDLVARRAPGDAARAALLVDAIDHMADHLPRVQGAMPSVFEDALSADIYRTWLDHPERDDFWRGLSPREAHARITVPVFNTAGWFDVFVGGSLANHAGMTSAATTDAARSGCRLVVGPWRHAHPLLADPAGDVTYGLDSSAAKMDLPGMQLAFFDRWLRGAVAPAAVDDPPVRLFILGEGRWRNEVAWPLARAVETGFHLRSGGSANSSQGDGRLDLQAPDEVEPADSFLADPADPVPTVGGNLCCWQLVNEPGSFDQRGVEDRQDVLVYSTAPLVSDLEVTGPVVLRVFVSSEAPDFDVTAKLLDVRPDGRALNLAEGIRRVRYRDGTDWPVLLPVGEVAEVQVDLIATANLFRAGHRIRLEVAASNWPRFDANPQTGASPDSASAPRVARHTVHHDAARPSCLVLPVVPRA